MTKNPTSICKSPKLQIVLKILNKLAVDYY